MKTLMALGLVVLLAIVAWGMQIGPFTPKTAYAATLERIMTRLKEDPDIRKRLEGRLRESCSAPVLPQVFCREAHFKVGFDLAQKGTGRLDRESATRRVVLLSEFLATVDEAACGALGQKDGGGTAGFRTAFERLSAQRLHEWEDLAVKAVTAELRGTPAEVLGDQEIAAAQAELLKGLDSQTRGRLTAMHIMKKTDQNLSAQDACWVGRTIFGRVAEMPEPHRSIMAIHLARD